MNVLESVAAELGKLSLQERRDFAAHVEAMSARVATDPLVSAEYRKFIAEFPVAFGLVENTD